MRTARGSSASGVGRAMTCMDVQRAGAAERETLCAVVAKRVVVSGQVQGVFFRASARREAERHGVGGWARNCSDGTVEALFEGDADAVERLVAWCREGPRGARVEHVRVEDAEPSGSGGFSVR